MPWDTGIPKVLIVLATFQTVKSWVPYLYKRKTPHLYIWVNRFRTVCYFVFRAESRVSSNVSFDRDASVCLSASRLLDSAQSESKMSWMTDETADCSCPSGGIEAICTGLHWDAATYKWSFSCDIKSTLSSVHAGVAWCCTLLSNGELSFAFAKSLAFN